MQKPCLFGQGGDLKKMIAELYGKATGCAKGKGGSMHLIDAARRVMGASAVVGTTVPNAVGYAYALSFKKDSIVVSFFGDGATDEESLRLNFAALKRLPIILYARTILRDSHPLLRNTKTLIYANG
jgi:TPP-dependent pyruvate/acetoin dehydrogenase alpha subunit